MNKIGLLLANALVLAVALGMGARACASPGQFDPTFGVNGAAPLSADQSNFLYVNAMAIQTDGRILVAGYGNRSEFLYRLSPNGTPDTSFGTGGMIAPNTLNTMSALVQPDGNIIVCGGGGSLDVLRYLPSGTADLTFGTNGISRTSLQAGGSQIIAGCAHAADGKVVAVGNISPSSGVYKAVALRLLANGTPDPSFGTNGAVQLTAPGAGAQFTAVALQADGKIVAAGSIVQSGTNYAAVMRLQANGTLDPGFGSGGVGIDPDSATAAQGGVLLSVSILPNGRIVASELRRNSLSNMPVVRFTAAGAFDAAFGASGAAASGLSYVRRIATQADNSILVAGAIQKSGVYRMAVARLIGVGVLDQGFGVGGVAVYDGASSGDGVGLALQPDGKVVAAGRNGIAAGDVDIVVVRLLGDEIIGTVVEFHNSVLDHFFVTADPAEAAAVDGGAAGPGWARTGFTFKSGGINRVCRFYGSTVINPATGLRRGPNSHFYTVDAAECGQVRQDPGWHFESYDFSTNPLFGATCQGATVPVYRAYNHLFAQNDSNHRLTTNLAAYNQTVAQGWTGEGVVMCAPQ